MAIRDINTIYEQMRFIVRKERGIYVTIDEAMQTLDSCQLDIFENLFADFEKNQKIHDGLRPFSKSQSFTASSTGQVGYQDDYMHFTGNAVTVVGSTLYKIKWTNSDEWADATRSQLRQPTPTMAIAKDLGKDDLNNNVGGFQLCPFQALYGQYDYLRRPATPVLAYIQVGRTITYDAGASTQLEWQDNYINSIMFAALSYWGINMSENDLVQYTELQKQQTQTQEP
jgi:hypothetical protein